MGLATFLLLRAEEREAKSRIKAEEKNLITLGIIDFISLAEYREFIDRIAASIPRDELNEVIHIYEPPGKLIYSNQSEHKWKISPEVISKYVNQDYFEIHQEIGSTLLKFIAMKPGMEKYFGLRSRPCEQHHGQPFVVLPVFSDCLC